MSNTYIFFLYAPTIFVMYYQANWIWFWAMLVVKRRKKPSLPCETRITKTQEFLTNTSCHNALCIAILLIFGMIINLHNHMYFFRYFNVFYFAVSFRLTVLIDITLIVYKNPFSNQWLYSLVTLYRIC